MNPLDVITTHDDLPEPVVPYYVPTSDGWFIHKDTTFGKVLVKVPNHPQHLPKVEPKMTLNGVKFPSWLVAQAHSFFRYIYDLHKTEAAVVVTYNQSTKDWKLFIPEQYTTHGAVHQKHDPNHLRPGYSAVGTIHSHCNFGAFHSGTDTHDADEFDGLHITLGHVDQDVPEYALMLAFNKQHFKVEIEDVIDLDDPGTEYQRTAPQWWARYVHPNQPAPWSKWQPKTQTSNWGNPGAWRGQQQMIPFDQRRNGVTYVNGVQVITNPSAIDRWDDDEPYAAFWNRAARDRTEQEQAADAAANAERLDLAFIAAEILDEIADDLADSGMKLYWSISPKTGFGAAVITSFSYKKD